MAAAVAAAVAAVEALLVGSAGAVVPVGNVVLNGDASAGLVDLDCSNGYIGYPIPNWVGTTMCVQQYASAGFPGPTIIGGGTMPGAGSA